MNISKKEVNAPNDKFKSPFDPNSNNEFSFLYVVARAGIVAGFLIVGYLTFLQFTQYDQYTALRFFKYLFLAMVIGVTLKQAKNYYPPITYFKRGIQLGAGVSALTALIVAIFNVFFFFIDYEYTFSKFGLEASTLRRLAVLDVTLGFEIVVFGMIITFICLQFLKYNDPSNEGIL